MTSLFEKVSQSRVALMGLATLAMTAFYAAVTTQAHAAASTTTGVDYVADLVTPIKSELTLAIVAGLGLLAILMAVRAGIKLVRGFAR